ncbi:hypothetical protein CA54_31650 [Symmachiella macrocystis]|uniref:Uncharacterized protein n=1 Tax=Symmachiella macrocystis TaxID=2527985 RepID=A0A5C6BSB0_9PLAN|nr:hypothetical protein [Symmachiella macrocystis]TWU14321.1 hypothetical protein CA54_31650 [Symmachiella macrocystis]
MADEATSPSPEISQDASVASSGIPKSIFLISYPKVVFLYPTFLAALFCGLYMTFSGAEPADSSGVLVTTLFLCVLAVNMIVLSFDFPRTTSLTLFFFVAAIITGGVLLFRSYPDLVPAITDFLKLFHPYANSHFFYFFATMIGLIFIAVAINVQFDYWEVRPNELLHHHGILSDLKRYSAPNLRIDKEINDVFEYVLLRSGRLILQARGESRAIILENVFFINRKEEQLTRMLGALQVQVRDQNAPH